MHCGLTSWCLRSEDGNLSLSSTHSEQVTKPQVWELVAVHSMDWPCRHQVPPVSLLILRLSVWWGDRVPLHAVWPLCFLVFSFTFCLWKTMESMIHIYTNQSSHEDYKYLKKKKSWRKRQIKVVNKKTTLFPEEKKALACGDLLWNLFEVLSSLALLWQGFFRVQV